VGSIEPEFRRISAWLDLVEALRIRDDEIFGTSGDTDLVCRLVAGVLSGAYLIIHFAMALS
jgi:hypothetical protein